MKNLRAHFNELRSRGNYSEMGQWFWDAFVFTTGRERKHYSLLWDSLTKPEPTKV